VKDPTKSTYCAFANLPQTYILNSSIVAGTSKGGKLVKDPTKSTVPDPTTIPSAEEFARNDNFGVVTAWCVLL